MKKLFLLLVFAVFGTALFADNCPGDFVITNDGVFYFKNVRHGISNFLVCKKDNGEKVTFTKFEVQAYCKDGQRFEKMPVYKNNKLTDDYAFMRVLSYKNGLKLYEYTYNQNSGSEESDYYVFKDDKLVVEVHRSNFESIKNFFKCDKK
ncbi:MAG: hypothetical protein JXR51_13470 [Bacteroidales bacterium]|nr:hypothetical protein [Bacteroidales bacterium]MBN2758176.1 hypothetical protein [Bacteroidales bacterium]